MDANRDLFASIGTAFLVFLFAFTCSVSLAGDPVYEDLIRVNDKVTVEFSNFYHDRSKGQTRCTTILKNSSQESLRLPIILTFDGLPDNVLVIGDGVLLDGTSYLDFTGQIAGGLFLPGTSTAAKIVSFSNPDYQRLTPSYSVWSARPLYVIAKASPTDGTTPLYVDFTAEYNGNIILFEWDFDGNGTFDWSNTTGPDTAFTYQKAGQFDAAIRITEDTGLTATGSVAIRVVSSPTSLVLKEEQNFMVSAGVEGTVPAIDSVLSFIIDELYFDTSDPASINDALEATLLGKNGEVLIDPHGNDRDSFLNMTEEQSPCFSPNVKWEGNKVSVDLKNLQPGTEFRLYFRLVNNDRDTETSVSIRYLQLEAEGQVIPLSTENIDYLYSNAGTANIQKDGWIDFLDFAILAANWETPVLGGKSAGDVNSDGIVDLSDLVTLIQYWCYLAPMSNQNLPLDLPVIPLGVTNENPTTIDFNRLSNISNNISAQYGITSLNEQKQILYTELELTNAGTYGVGKPLIMIIDHLSAPSVQVLGADGITPDGKPYYNLEGKMNGSIFAPSNTIDFGYLAFYNPNYVQFSYTLTILGMLNQPPQLTSSPVLEILVDKDYTYDSEAVDPDSDTLLYSLTSLPSGMTIDPATGLIQWKPSLTDMGNHSVLMRVEDGHGGFDTQAYQISVRNNVPNRPPVFTSIPVVEAFVNATYIYAAEVFDPDLDPLTFSLVQGPSDIFIDKDTGVLTWTPMASQVGTHAITLQAEDGRGGVSTQSYTINVQSESGNHPPIIISEPVLYYSPCSSYTYDVDAIDPDNDILTYQLVQKPTGMIIDPDTGLIYWLDASQEKIAKKLIDVDQWNGANGVIIYVNGNATGFNNGSSWSNAYKYLQDALAASMSGDQLWVTQGTYKPDCSTSQPTGSGNPAASFKFKKGIALYGGFAGAETDITQREENVNRTILSGDLSGNDDASFDNMGDNSDYVVIASIDSGNNIFDGFVITGGNKAGMQITQSNGTISNCTFQHNHGYKGGGVSISVSNTVFNNCIFKNNQARILGGGIYNTGSEGIYTNDCGIKPFSCKITLNRCEFTDNQALGWDEGGGGLYNHIGAYAKVSDCVFLNNSTTGTRGYGGAICSTIYSVLEVVNTKFRYNSASQGGGVNLSSNFASPGSQPTDPVNLCTIPSRLINCEFTGNSSSYPTPGATGGAVVMAASRVEIGNCLFIGNSSNYSGGAIGVQVSHVVVNNSTMVFNSAQEGNAVSCDYLGRPSYVRINNCILWDADGELWNNDNSDIEVDYSDIKGGWTGTGSNNIDIDPQFCSMPNDGGDGWGVGSDYFGNLHLTIDSPCIDGGNNLAVLSDSMDLDGDGDKNELSPLDMALWERFVEDPKINNNDNGNWPIVDVGAYEIQSRINDIEVEVSDGRGGVAHQSFTITATASEDAPFDLTIAEVDSDGLTSNQQTLETTGIITAEVSNSGPEDITAPFEVLFFEDRNYDGLFDQITDSILANTMVSEPLLAGQSITVTATANRTVLFPGNFVYGIVDSTDVIYEIDESNNIARSSNDGCLFAEKIMFEDVTGEYTQIPNGYKGLNWQNFWALNTVSYPNDSGYKNANTSGEYIAFNFEDDQPAEITSPNPIVLKSFSITSGWCVGLSATIQGSLQGNVKYTASFAPTPYAPLLVTMGAAPYNQPVDRLVFTASGGYTVFPGGYGSHIAVDDLEYEVHDAPNLTPRYVRYAITGENSTFTVRIGNNGVLLAPAGIPVSFYTGDPNQGGLCIGTISTTGKIEPGHFEDVSITLPFIDIDNLWVWADDDGTGRGTVSECNEEDNIYHPNFNGEPVANRSPYFTTTPMTTAMVGQFYRYNTVAWDPDGDTLSYDIPAGRPDGMAIDPAKGIVTWMPKVAQIGIHDIVLRVSDGQGGIDLQGFQIQVNSANSAPLITSEPLRMAAVNIPYLYAVLAQDAEEDLLSYDLIQAPTGMTIDQTVGRISWIPDGTQIGIHPVNITVNDGKGGQAVQSFDVSVAGTSQNEPPAITSTPRFIIAANESYLYQVEATDSNGDSLTYSLQTAPAGMTVDSEGFVQWIAGIQQFGFNTVRIHVEDGRGGLAYQEFTVNVVSRIVNNSPSIVSQPVFTVALGQNYIYDAQAVDSDNDPLYWSLDTAPTGMSVDARQGSIRWTPTASQTGSNQVVLRVIDGLGAWATQTYLINVNSVNTPPNITSYPSTEAFLDYPYTYTVVATDIEGDTLLFSLVTSPSGMTMDSSTGLVQWTPSSDQADEQAIVIRADDGKGGYAQQSYSIAVYTGIPNYQPEITSTPKGYVVAETIYEYQVQAVDPDSDTITYSLEIAPAGMTVDPVTGLIQWKPAVSQVGENFVKIAAEDTFGNTAFQSYSILVVNSSNFPVITSVPQGPATVGLIWSYDVIAHDPDHDPLTYSLSTYPQGMTIDEYGRIRWTPEMVHVGTHNIAIQAMDSYGLIAEQTFSLSVITAIQDTKKPTISLVLSDNPVPLGSSYTLTAWATDNVGVNSMLVTLAGSPVTLNAAGQATLTAAAVGEFEIVIAASDAAGNVSTGSVMLYVIDTNPDPNSPHVEITSPEYDTIITNITDIVGTVEDDNLLYYTLSVARADDESYTEIFHGTSTVTNGILGSFDPTILANDTYVIKLTAVDAAGNTSYTMIEVGVQGTLKLGNFTLSFTDLSIPVSGIPITVTRTYDSLNARTRQDLGFGWRLELKDTDLRTSLPKTGYEEEFGYFNAFYYGAKVYVTTPDGRRQGFTFIPEPPRGIAESILGTWHPAFTPDPGVTSQLTVQDVYLQYVEDTGEFYFYGAWAYNPADTELSDGIYTLTTAEGISYRIDGLTGDLQLVSDTNGNSLTFTEDAVISSAGPKVQLERDINGRITAVLDPSGNRVAYDYNDKGDLVSVTDRQGNVTQFVYRDDPAHYLDQIIDPLGRTGIRTEYDDQGRLIAMVDVNGKTVALDHDPANFTETVTDTLGNTKIYVYDERGNVTTEVDALGGTTTRTYDFKNYLLTETDPLGHTTTYTRDNNGNPLTVTDPLGNTTRYTYGSFNRLLTTIDPLGNSTIHAYDGKGNLISTTDAAGNKTTYTNDAAGNQTSVKDAMGNSSQYEYDSAGRLIRQTDALGHITTYTYDSNGNQLTQTTTVTTTSGPQTRTTTSTYDTNGRVIATTDAAGNVRHTEYNAVGKMSATIDALGRRTEYVYDERGLLIETILPDATPADNTDNPYTQTEYDAAGRTVAQIDALDRRTKSVYDVAGRIIETILPDESPDDLSDNPRTRTEYDISGQTIAQIDQRGNRTEFEYDAAGRQIMVRNALDQETTTAYDAAGRSVTQTDALGHTTDFEYDALGRVVKTIFADGSGTSTTYDSLGRAIAQTNQLGITTEYEYDALGRLTAVVDALGQQTEYSYDESGNQITQTDANGHTTCFEYDVLGRRVATILPLGQRSISTYDAAGNVISTTDFNGATITYIYDARNQLIAKYFPDGSATSFTYTLLGQRETITDDRGVTFFTYDTQNRLISRTDPDGTMIQYTYDLAGNRTSVTAPSGMILYTFDALNRQETVTDPEGGLTEYTYNGVGNLSRTDLPNGTLETRSYNTVNRLVYLENRSLGEIINSYQYTLDPIGNRIAVMEDTGRRVDYVYDALGRLQSESITDTVNGNRLVVYTLDPVGNRLSRNDSTEGITTYVYDQNDRLLSETLNSQTTTYTYDNNGNTLSRVARPTDSAYYAWNTENRLVAADVTDSTGTKQIDYQYDADGIRVSSTVNGEEIRYLIDASHPYQQVLEEYTPSHTIKASYVHGLDLISQKRGLARYFHHVDGLGSTCVLTDLSGQTTASYIYDAYGQLISQTGSTPNSYLFAGEQRDFNLGLDYLRARYMNLSVGRFYGMDTLEGSVNSPISLNKYIYGNANPIANIDPSGNFSIGEVSISISIISVLATTSSASEGFSPELINRRVRALKVMINTKNCWQAGPQPKHPYRACNFLIRDVSNTLGIHYFDNKNADTILLHGMLFGEYLGHNEDLAIEYANKGYFVIAGVHSAFLTNTTHGHVAVVVAEGKDDNYPVGYWWVYVEKNPDSDKSRGRGGVGVHRGYKSSDWNDIIYAAYKWW